MITCLACGVDKADKDFYLKAVPEDPTYHFCKPCTKAEARKNYNIAKKLIAEGSTITATCTSCLLEKEAKEFTPCQLGSYLTGFWAFCRLCANERSRANWAKKQEAKRAAAELLGEKAKKLKVSKHKANKLKTIERREAEAAFIAAQRVEELIGDGQKNTKSGL